MRGKVAFATVLALMTVALTMLGGAATSGAATCVMEPQLVNVTVNQGLGGYANLVRGKAAIVRGYWGVPSCMGTTDANGQLTNGGYIEIDSESLTVKNSTAGTTLKSNLPTTPPVLGPTFPLTNVVVGAPGRKDAPSDAKFRVDGSVFAPTTTTAAYTASFEIAVTFKVKASSGAALGPAVAKTYTTLSGGRSAITKPVAKKSNALPILIVPMGFPLDTASLSAVQDGMAAVSRVFPVPDGIGPLDGTSGGVRYSISPGLLNVADMLDGGGKFCGTAANFNTLKARLAAFLQAWNQSPTLTTLGSGITAASTSMTVAANTGFPTGASFRAYVDNELVLVSAITSTTWTITRGQGGTTAATHAAGAPVTYSTNQAQKVVGVVNAFNSTSSSSCFDGYASTAAPQAWIRLSDRAGALFNMELAHTFGVVPATRYDGLSPYHSTHADADSSNADSAYNTVDGGYLYDDHSAMRFVDGPSPAAPSTSLVTGPWTNADTVFEAADYAMILCKLGGPTTSDCATSGTTGTDVGVAAAPAVDAFTATGTVSGNTAHVTSSGRMTTVLTGAEPTSTYRLVQRAGSNFKSNGVPVSVADSIHSMIGAGEPDGGGGFFSVAYPFLAGATTAELWSVPLGTAAAADPAGVGGSQKLWSINSSQTPQIVPPATITGPTIGAPTTGVGVGVAAPDRGTPGPVENRPIPPDNPHFSRQSERSFSAAGVDPADATAIASAITTDPDVATGASFAALPPSGTPNGVGSSTLDGFPVNGDSFGILTTGDVNIANTANLNNGSGTADGGGHVRGDTDFDVSVLRIDLSVPTGADCLSLNFRFLSEEYPEYVNSAYNDGFIAELDSSTWTTSGSTITAPDNFAFDPSGRVVSVNSSGNTAMSAANANGTTYDGATPLLVAQHSITPGTHTLYLSIFDQGDQVYDSAVFLDNLIVGTTGPDGCTPGAKPVEPPTEQPVQVRVNDTDNPAGTVMTVTFFLRCPDVPNQQPVVLDVLVPVGEGGVATDTIEQGRQGCSIAASASDGWSFSPITDIAPSVLEDNLSEPPRAEITTPLPDRKYLQYDSITFQGSGYSSNIAGGVLSGDALSWSSSLFDTRPGNNFTLPPPAGGWTPGDYTVSLHVDGATSDPSVTVHILADGDHDGIPASIDNGGCLGGALGGDGNALNAGSDPDHDGLISIEDIFNQTADPYDNTAPCNAASAYQGIGLFLPNPISLSATAPNLSVAGIYVPHRNLAQVARSTVRISAANGISVPATAGLYAKAWAVTGALGGAVFDQPKLIAFLKANNIGPGGLILTITGEATSGQLGANANWRFDVPVTTLVKP
jgi:hypothetical protein